MHALQIEQLGKQYYISGPQANYNTLREALSQAMRLPLRIAEKMFLRPATAQRQDALALWALKDVSFTVEPGEVVGIIGRNGAGKSTLLKILSQITEPTRGQVILRGRVGALLEVGTGFHQELTGRENIFLNGAILGMKRAEITRKFDGIVAFAEIEKFIETPVKRYSSGMYMRLAFAIAAHLEPEILLVDEVLAVGDAAFQKKCLGKIGEISQQGRTVVFVSHNMAAIQSLCRRVIWLANGQIAEDGGSGEVVSNYLRSFSDTPTEQLWQDMTTAPGNAQIRLRRACIRPENEAAGTAITVRSDFAIEIDYWNRVPESFLNLSLILYNELGIAVFHTMPIVESGWHGKAFPAGLFRSVCKIPGKLLNNGLYRVGLMVVENQRHVVYRHDDLLSFEVQDSAEARGAWYTKWEGVIRPELVWETEWLEPLTPE